MADQINYRFATVGKNTTVFSSPTNVADTLQLQQLIQQRSKGGISYSHRRALLRRTDNLLIKPCADTCSTVTEPYIFVLEVSGSLLNKKEARLRLDAFIQDIILNKEEILQGLTLDINRTNIPYLLETEE